MHVMYVWYVHMVYHGMGCMYVCVCMYGMYIWYSRVGHGMIWYSMYVCMCICMLYMYGVYV